MRKQSLLYNYTDEADIYKAPPQICSGKPKTERGWGLLFALAVILLLCGPLGEHYSYKSILPVLGLFLACFIIVLTYLYTHGKCQQMEMCSNHWIMPVLCLILLPACDYAGEGALSSLFQSA